MKMRKYNVYIKYNRIVKKIKEMKNKTHEG